MLFIGVHTAIGLVVQLTTYHHEVLCLMPELCTRDFLCDGEGFHVEDKKEFIMNWFIKRGTPSLAPTRMMYNDVHKFRANQGPLTLACTQSGTHISWELNPWPH